MNRYLFLIILCLVSFCASAQVPVTGNPDQQSLLKSSDPKLAANKKFVYDFWREVIEGGHIELADKYMTEGYIQHNPIAPTGLKGFKEIMGQYVKPQPIQSKIKLDVVAVVAEGDLVVINFVQELPDPTDNTRKYTTTWFDMFRIENGKIAEHWDSALKSPPTPKK